MNWLVKWGIKKYALSAINTALATYKTNVDTALHYVDVGIEKAEAVLAYLKSIREKMADGKITDEETDSIIAESSAVVAKVIG